MFMCFQMYETPQVLFSMAGVPLDFPCGQGTNIEAPDGCTTFTGPAGTCTLSREMMVERFYLAISFSCIEFLKLEFDDEV